MRACSAASFGEAVGAMAGTTGRGGVVWKFRRWPGVLLEEDGDGEEG